MYLPDNNRKGVLSDETLHAEICAFHKFSNFKPHKKINILVIRVNRSGNMTMSRPCCKCIEKLKKLPIKIKNIYYSDENGKIICEKFSKL